MSEANEPTEFPRRIVCLTEETTETLYLLGRGDRIVGVSGYTVRPPEARAKPRVSAFVRARYERIERLRPDLVLAFSDLQAEIVRELVARGLTVFTFNQRSVDEILEMIVTLGRIVGAEAQAIALARRLRGELDALAAWTAAWRVRPRVFFEEWPEPLISGIRWVDELIEFAGGSPTFPELRDRQAARDRVVTPAEVVERDPEVIVASWCGRKLDRRVIAAREGFARITAVRAEALFEIKSTYILQPGPAALTEGVRQLHAILARVSGQRPAPGMEPEERLDPAVARLRQP